MYRRSCDVRTAHVQFVSVESASFIRYYFSPSRLATAERFLHTWGAVVELLGGSLVTGGEPTAEGMLWGLRLALPEGVDPSEVEGLREREWAEVAQPLLD